MRQLPRGSWRWAYSFNVYHEQVTDGGVWPITSWELTHEGALVKEFKYDFSISGERRTEIVDYFHGRTVDFFGDLNARYPHGAPFDTLVTAPGNRKTSHSLPESVARKLGKSYGWLHYAENLIAKTREAKVMKTIDRAERPAAVKGLYTINLRVNCPKPKGILVMDDVFDTGSTLKGVCDALTHQFNGVPLFILAFTDLDRHK